MLAVENVHKSFTSGSKEIQVLKGVELQLPKGKFIAIAGPSGAGKSTLLHILGGLDAPEQGRVLFEQEDIYALSDAAVARVRNEKIGFVFQFYHLLPEFTVFENVLMPVLIQRRPSGKGSEAEQEAMRLLEETGLSERLGHFPAQLSGGERQRVAIVRALINRPALLLCDEPTGNLDSKTGEEIFTLLKKINKEDQTTVILVTHNVELARGADALYHLRDGMLWN